LEFYYSLQSPNGDPDRQGKTGGEEKPAETTDSGRSAYPPINIVYNAPCP